MQKWAVAMEKAAHPMNPVHPAEAGKAALRMIQVHQAAAEKAALPMIQIHRVEMPVARVQETTAETANQVEAATETEQELTLKTGQDSAQETEHSPHRRTEQASAQQNKHSHRV
jgi:hypothetical protein